MNSGGKLDSLKPQNWFLHDYPSQMLYRFTANGMSYCILFGANAFTSLAKS